MLTQVTGILFEMKVDYTTWFGANTEYIHGIQVGGVNEVGETASSSCRLADACVCPALVSHYLQPSSPSHVPTVAAVSYGTSVTS